MGRAIADRWLHISIIVLFNGFFLNSINAAGLPVSRLEKIENDFLGLSAQVLNLEAKVEILAIDRWCEKTSGCFIDMRHGTLTFSDIPGLSVIFPGVPNEFRSKVLHLNVIGLTIDLDLLVANLDGLVNLKSLTLSNINWAGEFTTKRAYLPSLKKFLITSSQFTHDNIYTTNDANLKSVLFFDIYNDAAKKDWKLDEVHLLGVDINVNGQFIIDHSTGTLVSYKRSVDSLLENILKSTASAAPSSETNSAETNNIESNEVEPFELKYLFLTNYNVSKATKFPISIEYLGLNSVNILQDSDLNSVVKTLTDLHVLDLSFINAVGNPNFKFDISSIISTDIKTLKFGTTTITQSIPSTKFPSLETLRCFHTMLDDTIVENFANSFSAVENVFILAEDKAVQSKILRVLLLQAGMSVKNIMMPEFQAVGIVAGDEVDVLLKKAGITVSMTDSLIVMTKHEGKGWERGSRFNFWKH